MTAAPDRREKKSWIKDLIMAVITILSTLLIFSLTIANDEKIETNNKLLKLETDKAGVNYVDEKCKEIRNEQYKSEERLNRRLDTMEKNLIDVIKEQK